MIPPFICTSSSSSPFAQFSAPISREVLRQSARYRPAATAPPGQNSEFYEVQSSAGMKRWPRCTSVLDGMGGKHHLVRWIAKTEQEAFRAAAVEQLLSTQLGNGGPVILRAEAVARMQRLVPVLETEMIKGRATDYGSRCHALVERYLKEGELPAPDRTDPGLLLSFNAFLAWWETAGLVPVKVEARVSCAAHGVGGTLDVLVRDAEGRLAIVDLKTSKAVRDVEMSMQVACYAHCASLAAGEPIDYGLIVRVPKGQQTSRARAEIRRYDKDELGAALTAFESALNLYRFQRRVEGRDYGDDPLPVEGHA